MMFGLVFLCLVVVVVGQEPWSPCPQIFEYVNTGRQYEGLVKVQPLPPGETLKVTVVMYITAKLPSDFAGKLSVQSDNEIAAANSGTVNFHLDFPTQNPLPTIARILVNENIICQGREVTPRPSFLTTSTVSFTIFPPKIVYNSGPSVNHPTYYDTPVQQWPGPSVWEATSPPRPPQRRPLTSRTTPPTLRTTPPTPPTPARPRTPTRRPIVSKAAPAENCGIADVDLTQPLIQNGMPTQKGDWPWLAAIYSVKDNVFLCAGSLLDLNHVVTAAHCLQDRAGKKTLPSEVYVVIGKYNLKQRKEIGNQRKDVSQLDLHPSYNYTTFRNDIAIMTLQSAVVYSRFVRPICLWSKDIPEEKLVAAKNPAIVVGWGRDAKGNMNTEHPEMARAPIVSLATCRQERSLQPVANENTLCAGYRNGTGPCTGDSGGGLMLSNTENNGAIVRYYLQGVVSVAIRKSNTRDCNLLHYAVYTNVNKYLRWIRTFIVETYKKP